MPTTLVATIIGPDRPGLVESLSKTVTDNAGNWLQSRMSHLAGQFAGILQIEVPDESTPALNKALASLEGDGLSVVVVADKSLGESLPASKRSVLQMEVVGQDRPGIVRRISAVISAHGGNVEELNTQITSAPWSGETLFEAKATILMPEGSSLDEFRTDLEAITHDLMVDLSLAQRVG